MHDSGAQPLATNQRERDVVSLLDALAMSPGSSRAQRILATTDLGALVQSLGSQVASDDPRVVRELKGFDAVLASRGATAAYEAIQATGTGGAAFPALQREVGNFIDTFPYAGQLGPLAKGRRLRTVRVSGNTAILTYETEPNRPATVTLLLTTDPLGKMRIAGVRDWRRLWEPSKAARP